MLRSHLENPRQILCNTSLLQSWIDASGKSLQMISQVLCQSSVAEILNTLNATLFLNQVPYNHFDNTKKTSFNFSYGFLIKYRPSALSKKTYSSLYMWETGEILAVF